MDYKKYTCIDYLFIQINKYSTKKRKRLELERDLKKESRAENKWEGVLSFSGSQIPFYLWIGVKAVRSFHVTVGFLP